ncbi:AraC family transcriptional regulator [Pectobacterium parmentieri]|uniref:AraC family transcriptional regulator n=1 Tax=Pectobacterium parmentieri TaxID=1905730 RepID=A0A8B3F6Z7_PECPM|nr:AraC family transcriptional regulator [Pectobacterium parmentieri]AOR59410.1 transcriptional regulator [Pectobacterium parmentieri]AYH09613.1 AraC family transcriptional regulator [Pectobacterium parmentieri]AYH19678.1 AraC family transcriptional regulator [Pectobacterium parmentieri]AYH35925.1 AraC family transcriptional regulator [Pectobacterium parmentieri]AZS55994.1 AraC family transcriptional regulator [Pectobacterium parmentieri]
MKIQQFEYGAQHSTPWHKHSSGQLYWLREGIIVIETVLAQWTVTPGSVGWFPPDLNHRAWVPGNVIGNNLYLDPVSSNHFPYHAGIYGADHFIIALLERCNNSHIKHSEEYENLISNLLGYEIRQCSELPLELKLPTDRRARNVASELLKNPGCILDQSQLAQKWGLSVRNLSRLFNQQTGLSFSQWRQQAKVVASLQWVLLGLPVNEVASLSGYIYS